MTTMTTREEFRRLQMAMEVNNYFEIILKL